MKSEESIFSQKIVDKDFVPLQVDPLEVLTKVIQHRRSPFYDDLCMEFSISEYPKMRSSRSPIMLEEDYSLEQTMTEFDSEDLQEKIQEETPIQIFGKLHIFVLVHGLGGSQIDLLGFKNYISSINSNVDFIISNKNSGDNSHKDINELAQNLASEIEADIGFHDIRNIDKISFIGFSLGGVIIRAALPLISKYKSKFYSYMSLATPHLGVRLKK